uniref:Uncharacterized protein n=1 Tax=Mesocestoides corti TaxID=53468 RepID=A0A5K3FTB8_MESCO
MNYLIGRSSGGGGHTETAGHFTLTHNHHHQSTTHLAGTLPHRAGATSSDSTIATVLLFTLHPSSQRHPIPLHVPSCLPMRRQRGRQAGTRYAGHFIGFAVTEPTAHCTRLVTVLIM